MNKRLWLPLFAFALLFWGLRGCYWAITDEVPFSDILDYVRIGQSVADSFDFKFDSFWITYKPPGMPLFLGVIFKTFGPESLNAVRVAQTIVLFLGLLWIGYELWRRGTSLSLLFFMGATVALAKSSIFWSYKPATESLSEAFIYLNIASGLYLLRKPGVSASLLFGFIVMYSVLIRPQAALILPAAIVLVYLQKCIPKVLRLKYIALFLIAGFFTWLPWGIRNYSQYSNLLLFSTQGPYSFLWELGNIEIQDPYNPLKKIKKNVNELQTEASTQFTSDFEAMTYASYFVKGWLVQNWLEYFNTIGRRIYRTIVDRDEYLTKVPRTRIFDGSLNNILFDKSGIAILAGIIGLAFLGFKSHGPWLWVLIVPISQWFMGTLFLGYSRVLDPSLPAILMGNCVWVYIIMVKLNSAIRRPN